MENSSIDLHFSSSRADHANTRFKSSKEETPVLPEEKRSKRKEVLDDQNFNEMTRKLYLKELYEGYNGESEYVSEEVMSIYKRNNRSSLPKFFNDTDINRWLKEFISMYVNGYVYQIEKHISSAEMKNVSSLIPKIDGKNSGKQCIMLNVNYSFSGRIGSGIVSELEKYLSSANDSNNNLQSSNQKIEHVMLEYKDKYGKPLYSTNNSSFSIKIIYK
jgi:hypothetical protein